MSRHPRPLPAVRRLLLPLLLASFALTGPLASGTAHAQDNGAANTDEAQPDAAPAQPRTVAMSDVGVESERAKRRLAESRRVLAPSPEAAAATAAIPELSRRVDLQLKRSEAVRTTSPSVLALDRLQKEWEEIRSLIGKTQSTLRERGEEIEKNVESVRTTKALWTATRTRAIELEVSPEVIVQIDEVLAEAGSAAAEANERQASVLGLQSDVESLSEQAASDGRLIAAARNQAVGQVLQRDVAPIWSGDFWRNISPATIGEQLATQEARDTDVLVAYWAKHRDLIIAYMLLTAMLVVGMTLARGRIDARLAEDGDLATVRAIFKRPIALSLLVSFFGSLWIFDELVLTFEPVFGAATLIPAVLILRGVVDRPLLPVLTVGTSVFFAHQFQELVADAEAVSRLIFLAEMLTLVVFTALTLRPSRLADIPPEMARSTPFRLVGVGLRAVLLASAVSFMAEATGYSALANLMGGGIVLAIYAAIVLYGTYRVLDGATAFLLRVRPLRLLGMVSRHRWLVRQRVRLVLQLGGWFIWLRAVLRRLELWDDVEVAWAGLLDSELPFPEVTMTVGHIVAAAVVFWLALLASRFVQFALTEDVFSRMAMEKGRPYAISTLLHYSFLILGFVLGAAALGFDANRATLLTGAFGVGIGFGMQTIVNNFISGIILLTERPIQVGDSVAMGEVFGEVQRIGIRSSTVRTWQGAEVIVPNADLIAQQVTNWTKSDRKRRMEVPVGVQYGSEPQVVIDALMSAAAETEGAMKEPAPYVIFKGFGDSALDFELRAWTDDFDNFLSVKSRMAVNMVAALAQAGLEVPFPQRDLHVKTVGGAVPGGGTGE